MPRLSQTPFSKGDQVEVLQTENDNSAYYAATVLRSSSIQKDRVLVHYQTLNVEPEGSKRMSALVDVKNVRPMPPRELIECFKVEDVVDVFCEKGWRKGYVKDILENSKYLVGFEGNVDDFVAAQCSLRLHREWADGSWVPPVLDQNEFGGVEAKSTNLRLKIKNGKRKPVPKFKKGRKVEVRSDEDGYQGAWYTATIVDSLANNKYLVEYFNLVTDDGTTYLKEVAKALDIRPSPPAVHSVAPFKQLEKVDAWFNEGWWEGMVWKVLDDLKYKVYFSHTHDSLEVAHSNLRPHLEWSNGIWIKEKSIGLDRIERPLKTKFSEGAKVEVKSDEVGFEGAWFTATIVDVMENDKFLVEYHDLLDDAGTGNLIEVASAPDIRPLPPEIQRAFPYKMWEMVEAWYNDGWWVGHVVKVHEDLKYSVHFKSKEVMDFQHCELRHHQEWINGNWKDANFNL